MSNHYKNGRFRSGKQWELPDELKKEEGMTREVEGLKYIYFDKCWILYYEPPEDTLLNRKKLINHLTKRTFHNTEAGINTPGYRLDEARLAYEGEDDPKRKRINAAMLAGALFNHATDIFTAIAELGSNGVAISRSNELMKECGACFKEALELGKKVKHFSGEEGIDEIWGEPFRAFTVSPGQFYTSRYIKIAQTWHNIDRVTKILSDTFLELTLFKGLAPLVEQFAVAAKCESETMKTDKCIFQIWPEFVSSFERLGEFRPNIPAHADQLTINTAKEGLVLVNRGKDLIDWIAAARVPMPKSTKDYQKVCKTFKNKINKYKDVSYNQSVHKLSGINSQG